MANYPKNLYLDKFKSKYLLAKYQFMKKTIRIQFSSQTTPLKQRSNHPNRASGKKIAYILPDDLLNSIKKFTDQLKPPN